MKEKPWHDLEHWIDSIGPILHLRAGENESLFYHGEMGIQIIGHQTIKYKGRRVESEG